MIICSDRISAQYAEDIIGADAPCSNPMSWRPLARGLNYYRC